MRSGGGQRQQDRNRSLLALLAATLLLAGCEGTVPTASPTRTPPSAGSSAPPGAAASAGLPGSTAVPSSAPTTTPPSVLASSPPTSSPPAGAAPEPPHAVRSDLVARVLVYPDVWAGLRPWPNISVYADGRVIGADGVRWLTPAGVAAMRDEFARTGLFTAGRVIEPRPMPSESPTYGHGYTTYVMTARVGAEPVTVRATNDLPSAEGQRLLDAADRLSHPETWLPADAWVPGWEAPRRYVPDRWLLEVAWATHPGALASSSPDISSVDWPFGPPERFGAPDPRLEGGGVTARCAVVPDADVQRLLASLRAQGVDAPAPTYYLSQSLGWWAGYGRVDLGLEPALPDDGTDCVGMMGSR